MLRTFLCPLAVTGRKYGARRNPGGPFAAAKTWHEGPLIVRKVTPRPQPASNERMKALASSSTPIPVPGQLRNPHPFVSATRMKVETARPQDDGRIYLRSEPGTFQLRVSRDTVGRSLLILQAICDKALRRGWTIESRSGSPNSGAESGLVAIGRHAYQVSIEERQRQFHLPTKISVSGELVAPLGNIVASRRPTSVVDA